MSHTHMPVQSQGTIRSGTFGMFLRQSIVAMRPWQWTKNCFVFLPMVFAGKLLDAEVLVKTGVGFLALVAATSALYLVNDIVDVESDREHPKKRNRPLASGAVSIRSAACQAIVLAIAAIAIASALGPASVRVLLAYVVLTLLYTSALKKMLFIDCIAIAVGFVLRVVLGSVTASVEPSHWLLICTFLLALFLAFTKRESELKHVSVESTRSRAVLTGYAASGLLSQVNGILLSATLTSYMLYAVAPETISHLGTTNLVYGSVFVVYGLLRYLYLARRNTSTEDPAAMLIADKPMLLTVFLWGCYNVAVIYLTGATV